MSDSPVDDYIMSYGGEDDCRFSFVELFGYLFWETALVVTGLYLVVGLLVFIVNRKWKLIWLPLLYAILGGIVGVVYGSTFCHLFLLVFTRSGRSCSHLHFGSVFVIQTTDLVSLYHASLYHLLL